MHQPPGLLDQHKGDGTVRLTVDQITGEIRAYASACEVTLWEHQIAGKRLAVGCARADSYTVSRKTQNVEALGAPTPCALCVLRSVSVSFDWLRKECGLR